jgi:hypothetical protein
MGTTTDNTEWKRMSKENFKTDSRVEFHSTASELDGKTGTILGISSSHAECNFWIVGLDEPLPERRAFGVSASERRAVVIIDSCLKLAN